jgi:hypothetical protein
MLVLVVAIFLFQAPPLQGDLMRDSRLTRRIKKKIASETAARLAAQPPAQNNAACSLSPMEGRRALPEKIAGSAVISHQQATLKKNPFHSLPSLVLLQGVT